MLQMGSQPAPASAVDLPKTFRSSEQQFVTAASDSAIAHSKTCSALGFDAQIHPFSFMMFMYRDKN